MKSMIFILSLIIIPLFNIYGDYVANINYRYQAESDRLDWLSEIFIGMQAEDLIIILDNNNIRYRVVEATLGGHRRYAERKRIYSICIDLIDGGNEEYPSD